jgi:tellurite resistance protein TerC
MPHAISFWTLFHIIIAALLAFDFLLFRRSKRFSVKTAWALSVFWILLALLFNGLIYALLGGQSAVEFFTAYLVEKSLSIDNLFVFLFLFTRWKLSLEEQRQVLFWGVLGAIVLRLLFILGGIKLLSTWHWMVYVLGAFLCFTGIKMVFRTQKEPFSFLVKGKNHAFILALLTIELTDVLFALDSIPAVLAITSDPFIAYTSNVFAILGLRSLYFVISPLLKRFIYLNWALAAILVFVGLKMLLSGVYAIPVWASLLIIVAILGLTFGFSLSRRFKK